MMLDKLNNKQKVSYLEIQASDRKFEPIFRITELGEVLFTTCCIIRLPPSLQWKASNQSHIPIKSCEPQYSFSYWTNVKNISVISKHGLC